jgi:hypothetical protein
VQVLTEQDAVRGYVCPARGIRFDVGRFEHMENGGVCESTTSIVGVSNDKPK